MGKEGRNVLAQFRGLPCQPHTSVLINSLGIWCRLQTADSQLYVCVPYHQRCFQVPSKLARMSWTPDSVQKWKQTTKTKLLKTYSCVPLDWVHEHEPRRKECIEDFRCAYWRFRQSFSDSTGHLSFSVTFDQNFNFQYPWSDACRFRFPIYGLFALKVHWLLRLANWIVVIVYILRPRYITEDLKLPTGANCCVCIVTKCPPIRPP